MTLSVSHIYELATRELGLLPGGEWYNLNLTELLLGQGAYGVVIAATDRRTNTRVAMKRVHDTIFDTPMLFTRCIRELEIQAHMNHENVIGLHDVLFHPNHKTLYVVLERADFSLREALRPMAFATMDFQLGDDHYKYFAYQMLVAVNYLHNTGIIHRDITPANILLNTNCGLKLCDFGLAKPADNSMSNYVTTRWYRAPEVVMGLSYGPSVDVWALGCIIGELFTRKPLFPVPSARTHRADQLTAILSRAGSPGDAFIERIQQTNLREFLQANPYPENTLDELLPQAMDPSARELVKAMLKVDPAERITLDDAIRHPFVADYFEDDEGSAYALSLLARPVPIQTKLPQGGHHEAIMLLRNRLNDIVESCRTSTINPNNTVVEPQQQQQQQQQPVPTTNPSVVSTPLDIEDYNDGSNDSAGGDAVIRAVLAELMGESLSSPLGMTTSSSALSLCPPASSAPETRGACASPATSEGSDDLCASFLRLTATSED